MRYSILSLPQSFTGKICPASQTCSEKGQEARETSCHKGKYGSSEGKKITIVVVKQLKTGAQSSWEIPIDGDFQNLTGLSPQQPVTTLKSAVDSSWGQD